MERGALEMKIAAANASSIRLGMRDADLMPVIAASSSLSVPGCGTLSRHGESKAPISFGPGEFTMDYAAAPRDRELVTTISWRLAHLVVVFASTTASHFGGPPAVGKLPSR